MFVFSHSHKHSHSHSRTMSHLAMISVSLLACLVFAPFQFSEASPSSPSAANHELSNLMSLLGKLKDVQRLRNTLLDSQSTNQLRGKPSSPVVVAVSGNPASSPSSSASRGMDAILLQKAAILAGSDRNSRISNAHFGNDNDVGDRLINSNLPSSSSSLSSSSGSSSSNSVMGKRQGAWSLDYGLGGGRFGKRGGNYGFSDYGLGGGRFGRDVDHVDPNHDWEVDPDSL